MLYLLFIRITNLGIKMLILFIIVIYNWSREFKGHVLFTLIKTIIIATLPLSALYACKLDNDYEYIQFSYNCLTFELTHSVFKRVFWFRKHSSNTLLGNYNYGLPSMNQSWKQLQIGLCTLAQYIYISFMEINIM